MEKICQSCAMPLKDDVLGTEFNNSKNQEYCYFCYRRGKFVLPNLTLSQQIERLTQMGVEKFNVPEAEARERAQKILPTLKRWKK